MAPFVRRVAFEGARAIHLTMAHAAVASLIVHIAREGSNVLCKVYLLAAVSCWMAVLLARAVYTVYRSRGTQGYILGYEGDETVVQLVVDFKRPWQLEPGQFAYITIPAISSTAALQSHPFQVAWWDQSLGRAFFLISARKGFTRNLLHHRSAWLKQRTTTINNTNDWLGTATPVRTIIEGPYGLYEDLRAYGTVLMIATGLGVASQLPYIKHILDGHMNREARTQKISLFWQIRQERTRSIPQ